MDNIRHGLECRSFNFYREEKAGAVSYRIEFKRAVKAEVLAKLDKLSKKFAIQRLENSFSSDQTWKINKVFEKALALDLISSEEYMQVQKELKQPNESELKPRDEDVDEAMGIGVEEFHDQIVEIKPDSPFYDTDLVVFKEAYQGRMPLNGISEKNFLLMERLYSLICMGDSYIKFEAFPDNRFIFEQIKLLLTRSIGREMLTRCALQKPYEVTIKCHEARNFYRTKEREICLMPRLSEHGNIELHPYQSQRLRKVPKPSHIVLAHELVHHLHAVEDAVFHAARSKTRPSEPAYDNLEEEFTITGFLSQKNLEHGEMYDKFNERAIQAAFVKAAHKIFPRLGHKYILNIDMRRATSAELYKYAASLYSANLVLDVVDFLLAARKNPTPAMEEAKFKSLLERVENRLVNALKKTAHPWHHQLMLRSEAVEAVTKIAEAREKSR